jgi:hypothetical protein
MLLLNADRGNFAAFLSFLSLDFWGGRRRNDAWVKIYVFLGKKIENFLRNNYV